MSFFTLFSELGPAIAIVSPVLGQIEAGAAELTSGQAVDVPQIRTYIAGKHLAIDVKVQEIQAVPAPGPTQA